MGCKGMDFLSGRDALTPFLILIPLVVLGMAPLAMAEGHASAMRSIEVTPDAVGSGKGLYAVCAGCHGPDGEGRTGIGPRLNSETFLAAASDDFLMSTISKGRPGTTMTAWGAMYNEDQIKAVVAYLRSWNEVAPAKLDESPLKGDATAGEESFQSICSSCHGRSGGGYMETANGTGIGRKAFLDEATDGYLRYLIKNGKSGTAMRPFDTKAKTAVANLSDQEIEDIIAFLRKNAW